jgi:hypothetical protein
MFKNENYFLLFKKQMQELQKQQFFFQNTGRIDVNNYFHLSSNMF